MRQAMRVFATAVSKSDFQIIQYDIPDNIFYWFYVTLPLLELRDV